MIAGQNNMVRYSNAKPLLIMLPFAGGNSYSYRDLTVKLEDKFDILCPELPGRGELYHQECIGDMNELIEELFQRLAQLLNMYNNNYYIYGHSMGALLTYLLTHRINKEKMALPSHIIVSGSKGPSRKRKKIIHHSSKELFRKELKEIGGMPEEILNNEEAMEYFEPILRADFKVVETYTYHKTKPLTIPMTAFYGSDEGVNYEDVCEWQKETNREVNIIEVEGDHFFIYKHIPYITSYIKGLVEK